MKNLFLLLATLLAFPAAAEITARGTSGETTPGYTMDATEIACLLVGETEILADTWVSQPYAPGEFAHTWNGDEFPDTDAAICRARHTWTHDASGEAGATAWTDSQTFAVVNGALPTPSPPGSLQIIPVTVTVTVTIN